METLKTIPPWFKLDNYCNSINFTAKEWLEEIDKRTKHAEILRNPSYFTEKQLNSDDSNPAIKSAIDFFADIKKEPLVSDRIDVHYPELEAILKGFKITEREYKQKFSVVLELSEYKAYSFFLDSNKKSEIEKDCSIFSISPDYEDFVEKVRSHRNARIKYSQPIANHEDHEGTKFLEIELCASDEQILKEFKNWLIETRNSSNKFIKRQFSTKDFQDWHESQLLPYWDLTTIAAIENVTLPYHVIGAALFPDEYGVDLTERIRKITKRKCQFVFSGEVYGVLMAQAQSEKLGRNNL